MERLSWQESDQEIILWKLYTDLFSRFTIHFFFSNKIFHLLLSEYFPPVVLISREIFPLLESIGGEIGFAIKRQMSTTSPCSPFIPYNLWKSKNWKCVQWQAHGICWMLSGGGGGGSMLFSQHRKAQYIPLERFPREHSENHSIQQKLCFTMLNLTLSLLSWNGFLLLEQFA